MLPSKRFFRISLCKTKGEMETFADKQKWRVFFLNRTAV